MMNENKIDSLNLHESSSQKNRQYNSVAYMNNAYDPMPQDE